MEKSKRFIKTFLIIIGFLIVNTLIDTMTGLVVPRFVALVKTGEIINSKDFTVYGILAGQIIKLVILSFFIKRREKSFKNKLDRNYIQREKI